MVKMEEELNGKHWGRMESSPETTQLIGLEELSLWLKSLLSLEL